MFPRKDFLHIKILCNPLFFPNVWSIQGKQAKFGNLIQFTLTGLSTFVVNKVHRMAVLLAF